MGMSIRDIKELIFKAPPDISIGLWGPPGIGKTDCGMQVAEAIGDGCGFMVKLAATMDPTDLVGIPFPSKDNATTDFLPPLDLFKLTIASGDTKPYVVLFDDITTANPQVFAALFRLFQHREVAGLKIRDNVKLIATGNRVEDNAAANDMPTALNNRFFHIDVTVNYEEWVAWAIQNNVEPSFVAYIKHMPQMIHQFKPDSQERAFATPRSIVMASKMEAAVGQGHKLWGPAIDGCVGPGWSAGYRAFVKSTSMLVKPEEILKDPQGCRVPAKEKIDVTHATIQSLIHYIKLHSLDKTATDNCLAAFVYLQRIANPDMGVSGIHLLVNNVIQPHKDPSLKAKVLNSKTFTELVEKHGYLVM
jgi:hypothetical protein